MVRYDAMSRAALRLLIVMLCGALFAPPATFAEEQEVEQRLVPGA